MPLMVKWSNGQMVARNDHRELQKVPNVCQEFGQKLKMIAKKWAN